jgi:hypothetical protein
LLLATNALRDYPTFDMKRLGLLGFLASVVVLAFVVAFVGLWEKGSAAGWLRAAWATVAVGAGSTFYFTSQLDILQG